MSKCKEKLQPARLFRFAPALWGLAALCAAGFPGCVSLETATAPVAPRASEPAPGAPDRWEIDAGRLEEEIVRLTNEARIQADRLPLRHSPLLSEIARAHSEEMARLGRLSHESPTSGLHKPHERLAARGVGYRRMAENIAWEPCVEAYWSDGRVERFSLEEVARNTLTHWAHSPGHWANLLLPDAREIGVGAAVADEEGRPYVYITQVFVAPL